MNVELALRHNRVVVICDSTARFKPDNGAEYVDMGQYRGSGLKFEPEYKHMSKDISYGKRKYELQCFIRWYVLRDYMVKNNLTRVSGTVGSILKLTFLRFSLVMVMLLSSPT